LIDALCALDHGMGAEVNAVVDHGEIIAISASAAQCVTTAQPRGRSFPGFLQSAITL
jgi:hypothetical protein